MHQPGPSVLSGFEIFRVEMDEAKMSQLKGLLSKSGGKPKKVMTF